jgi:hypothetical protein
MRSITMTLCVAAALLCASCASHNLQYTPDANTPESAFYQVADALQKGDVATAKQYTLYGDFVDWDAVLREVSANPDKYRIKEILYKDESPQLFTSSVIYYRAKDGNNYMVEFTRVNNRWYWGSRLKKGQAQILSQRFEENAPGAPQDQQENQPATNE